VDPWTRGSVGGSGWCQGAGKQRPNETLNPSYYVDAACARYLEVFAEIHDALPRESACVLVHCRSGRDRSAFAVYAFLRVMLAYTDDEAREALLCRRGVDGTPDRRRRL